MQFFRTLGYHVIFCQFVDNFFTTGTLAIKMWNNVSVTLTSVVFGRCEFFFGMVVSISKFLFWTWFCFLEEGASSVHNKSLNLPPFFVACWGSTAMKIVSLLELGGTAVISIHWPFPRWHSGLHGTPGCHVSRIASYVQQYLVFCSQFFFNFIVIICSIFFCKSCLDLCAQCMELLQELEWL